MENRLRVSRVLILNTLCCGIAVLAAWDWAWLYAYRGALHGLILDLLKMWRL